MPTFAYTRVSTERQKAEGFSMEAQQTSIQRYAEQRELTVTGWFFESKSAKQAGRRKKFRELIDAIKRCKEPVHLIVDKTDRMCRNFEDAMEIQRLVRERQLTVHFVRENFTLDQKTKSHEKFMHYIQLSFATYYSDNLSDEAKKGMYQRAAQGWYTSKAPYGYKNLPKGQRKGDPIIIVEEEADFVRRAFTLYASGCYSLEGVAQQLKDEGYIYRPDKPTIDRGTLGKMLHNRFYIGQFSLVKKLHAGAHQPIITRSLFDATQRAFEQANRPKVTKHHEFLFRGLLTCGECGRAITAQIQKGRYIYYRCTNSKGNCNSVVYVPEKTITDQAIKAFQALKVPEKALPAITDSLKRSHENEIVAYKKQSESLQRQITLFENKLDKILEGYTDGTIGYELFIRKQNQYQDELHRLKAIRDDYSTDKLNYIDKAGKLLELARSSDRLFLTQSIEEKRKLINLVLSNCQLKGEKLSYEYHAPFSMIEKMTGCESWWSIGDSNS